MNRCFRVLKLRARDGGGALLIEQGLESEAELSDLSGIARARSSEELIAESEIAVRGAPKNRGGESVEHAELRFFR